MTEKVSLYALAEFMWGDSVAFLKGAVKIAEIFIPNAVADLRHLEGGGF